MCGIFYWWNVQFKRNKNVFYKGRIKYKTDAKLLKKITFKHAVKTA